ncbi:MAG TPA: glucose 1-dehydrogenase [Alphaproteobacteria bacterium]|nr:glucose 1-dehydrogenase [Alphaproteobacteria bacterium]
MGRLDGKVALVSGGARGMGASHARELVKEGARVVIGDVLEEEGKALAAELGDDAHFVKLDVTSEADWQAAVAEAESAFGPLTVLVNNAGILDSSPIDAYDLDRFRRIIDINLGGVFLGMKHATPSLRKNEAGAAIINISSTAGLMGYANMAGYVASKWGVRGITKTAAMELGKDRIRVNSIHPGPIHTPMTEGIDDAIVQGQALSRFGEPEEVSRLVVYLAADATYATGAEFLVDGGQVLGPVGAVV